MLDHRSLTRGLSVGSLRSGEGGGKAAHSAGSARPHPEVMRTIEEEALVEDRDRTEEKEAASRRAQWEILKSAEKTVAHDMGYDRKNSYRTEVVQNANKVVSIVANLRESGSSEEFVQSLGKMGYTKVGIDKIMGNLDVARYFELRSRKK